MTEIEKFVAAQLFELVPNSEKFEVRLYISKKSYSVEFWAVVDGKRLQCFDMIDNGLIQEKSFDDTAKAIVDFIRKTDSFDDNRVSKYSFTA